MTNEKSDNWAIMIVIIILLGLVAVVLLNNLSAFGRNATNSNSSTSGNLNVAQIAGYASTAGWTGDDLVTAVAIALAESSGNPAAIGDSGNSIGLWQIDIVYHPEFSGDDLTNPQTNANDAYQIYTQSGFSAWSTFTNGAYEAYVTTAQIGVQNA